MKVKERLIAACALLLATVLAGTPAPRAWAADELVVRIGHAAPVSSWLAGVGLENELAARLGVDDLNGRGIAVQGRPVRFELVVADDAGDADRARAAARELLGRGVVAVVGHLLSGSTMAAAPLYAAAGIAQVSPASSIGAYSRSGWPTAFRLAADDGRMSALLARDAVERLAARRFVLIDDRSAFGQALAVDFAQALRAVGAEVVGRFQVDEAATDLRATLAAAQALAPDAVFFGGFDRQAGLLLQQMRRLGFDAWFVSGDAVCTQDLVSFWAAGAARDGQVLCALPAGVQADAGPAMARFAAAFARRAGYGPQFYGAYAYDAVMLVGDAVRRAGSAAPADVRQALAQTRDYPGLTGPIGFDAKGDVLGPAVSLYTYRGEQRVLLRTVR
jgi:branched-chain amino acid transport system substrate-binding protein